MSLELVRTSEIAMGLPKGFWIARAITFTTGIGLQLVGIYGAAVTFGAWLTLGLYAMGGLAIVLQHVVLRRTPCSLGD